MAEKDDIKDIFTLYNGVERLFWWHSLPCLGLASLYMLISIFLIYREGGIKAQELAQSLGIGPYVVATLFLCVVGFFLVAAKKKQRLPNFRETLVCCVLWFGAYVIGMKGALLLFPVIQSGLVMLVPGAIFFLLPTAYPYIRKRLKLSQ